MIFNIPGINDINALKSAELFSGNIDEAPLGVCRMAAGTVTWSVDPITVFTIASGNEKLQVVVGNGSYSASRMRVYSEGTWGNWQVLPTYVVDDLTSASPGGALSANQGRVLKGLVDGKLEKTGGTLTGQTTVAVNSTDPVIVKNTGNGNADIVFQNASGTLGKIGVTSANKPVFVDGNTNNEILTTGTSLKIIASVTEPAGDNILWAVLPS